MAHCALAAFHGLAQLCTAFSNIFSRFTGICVLFAYVDVVEFKSPHVGRPITGCSRSSPDSKSGGAITVAATYSVGTYKHCFESRNPSISTNSTVSIVPGSYLATFRLSVLARLEIAWFCAQCCQSDRAERFPASDHHPENRRVTVVSLAYMRTLLHYSRAFVSLAIPRILYMFIHISACLHIPICATLGRG